MQFKEYESKPITRRAYEIKESDVITKLAENRYKLSDSTISFCAYEDIKPGDYIVYLNESDVYHCNQTVFKERNIV